MRARVRGRRHQRTRCDQQGRWGSPSSVHLYRSSLHTLSIAPLRAPAPRYVQMSNSRKSEPTPKTRSAARHSTIPATTPLPDVSKALVATHTRQVAYVPPTPAVQYAAARGAERLRSTASARCLKVACRERSTTALRLPQNAMGAIAPGRAVRGRPGGAASGAASGAARRRLCASGGGGGGGAPPPPPRCCARNLASAATAARAASLSRALERARTEPFFELAAARSDRDVAPLGFNPNVHTRKLQYSSLNVTSESTERRPFFPAGGV